MKKDLKLVFTSWGFIAPWANTPFDKGRPRSFDSRQETIEEKKLFSGSWKYKRCLITASGFFEKKYRIRKENYKTFLLGGIWSKWTSLIGAELEICSVLTTKPNSLVKLLHHRMPVVVPNDYEKLCTEQFKDTDQSKGLLPIIMGWSPDRWILEEVNNGFSNQMTLLWMKSFSTINDWLMLLILFSNSNDFK